MMQTCKSWLYRAAVTVRTLFFEIEANGYATFTHHLPADLAEYADFESEAGIGWRRLVVKISAYRFPAKKQETGAFASKMAGSDLEPGGSDAVLKFSNR